MRLVGATERHPGHVHWQRAQQERRTGVAAMGRPARYAGHSFCPISLRCYAEIHAVIACTKAPLPAWAMRVKTVFIQFVRLAA